MHVSIKSLTFYAIWYDGIEDDAAIADLLLDSLIFFNSSAKLPYSNGIVIAECDLSSRVNEWMYVQCRIAKCVNIQFVNGISNSVRWCVYKCWMALKLCKAQNMKQPSNFVCGTRANSVDVVRYRRCLT